MNTAIIQFHLTKKIGGKECSHKYEDKLRQKITALYESFRTSNILKKGTFDTLKENMPKKRTAAIVGGMALLCAITGGYAATAVIVGEAAVGSSILATAGNAAVAAGSAILGTAFTAIRMRLFG